MTTTITDLDDFKALDPFLMVVDILSAFVATDYGFKKWRRERAGKTPRKLSKPPRGNSHGSASADSGEGR